MRCDRAAWIDRDVFECEAAAHRGAAGAELRRRCARDLCYIWSVDKKSSRWLRSLRLLNPDLNQRVATNFRRLRQELSLSQEEAADKCGLHRTYIGAIERGERNITLTTLEQIATALNVDPLDLLKEGKKK